MPIEAKAVEMFKTFARCEYALKASGYFMNIRGRAEADWARFAKAVAPVLADAEGQLAGRRLHHG